MIVNKINSRLGKSRRLIAGRLNLYRLGRTESQIARSLASALQTTMKKGVSSEEKVWVDKIEVLRNELTSSTVKITKVDFGEGKQKSTKSNEDMDKGLEEIETIGTITRNTSKPPIWAFLLFRLIRETKPAVCIEMGTSVGISGAYQAAALKLNQNGHIITLEGSELIAKVAENNFRRLDLDNIEVVVGRFQDTLCEVLNKHQPIDYVFVDGHHDEQATIAYFEQIYPFLSEQAIIVFDDIPWSEGMRKAWTTIAADEKIDLAVNLSSVGICILDKTISKKQNFRIEVI